MLLSSGISLRGGKQSVAEGRARLNTAEWPGIKKERRSSGPALSRFPAATYSPTPFPVQYHRRCDVSLLCSEWEQVGPSRHSRRKGKALTTDIEGRDRKHVFACSRSRGNENGQAARLISTARLNVSPRLHLQPINLVVFEEPSGAYAREILSWEGLHAYMLSAFIPAVHSYPAVPLARQLAH